MRVVAFAFLLSIVLAPSFAIAQDPPPDPDPESGLSADRITRIHDIKARIISLHTSCIVVFLEAAKIKNDPDATDEIKAMASSIMSSASEIRASLAEIFDELEALLEPPSDGGDDGEGD